ncbi:hypothetical protein LTR85_006869 [Meristemomyces frigidus]|nr:hypothetical protein LTR85_006869 [Meristemomyces frigidus]
MDPLSVSASIIAVLQLAGSVLSYLKSVHDAPKECEHFAQETTNLHSLLVKLLARLQEPDSAQEWYREVRWLAVSDGPLDQCKTALAKLDSKLAPAKGVAKLTRPLLWKLIRADVNGAMARTERLKTLTQIALQMDHFKLSQAISHYSIAIKGDTVVLRADAKRLEISLKALVDSTAVTQGIAHHIKDDTASLRDVALTERKLAIAEWLCRTDYSEQQHDHLGIQSLYDVHTDKHSVRAVKLALDKLPSGSNAYDETYKEAMERIRDSQPKGDAELAVLALSWITRSRRPLGSLELQHALAIGPGQRAFNVESLIDIAEVLSVCMGLVTSDEHSNVVRLVHYTAQKFLDQHRTIWLPNADTTLLVGAVTHLRYEEFCSPDGTSKAELKRRLKRHAILGYSAMHWADHARAVEERTAWSVNPDAADAADAVILFLTCKAAITFANQIWRYQKKGKGKDKDKEKGVFISPLNMVSPVL